MYKVKIIYRSPTKPCDQATNMYALHMGHPKTIVQTKTITVSPPLTKKVTRLFL